MRLPIETQASITLWSRETFGLRQTCSTTERIRRFKEEVAELLIVLDKCDGAHYGPELADVYQTLAALASALQLDLHGEVDRKMAYNRASEWVPNAEGRIVRKGKEHRKAFDDAMPTIQVVPGVVADGRP